ncbi:MAG TPA: hypothetical protein VIU82_26045 [Bosea sp. (in: a-proteobacteria)]
MSESSPEQDGVLISPDTNLDASTASDSSTEANQGAQKSPSDLVFEALKLTEKESSPDSEQDPSDPADTQEGAEAKAEDAEAAPKADLGEITPEELKKYGPKTQERMQQLLSHRHELRTELEAVRPKAQQFEAIEEFAASSRISMKQVGDAIELAALANSDNPEAALDKLIPIVQQLMQTTGRTLPDDIKERVRLGYIGEEEAKRLVRSEAEATRAKEAAAREREERESQAEANRLANLKTMSETTAADWEAARKRSDPDWQSKQSRFGELIKVEVYENGFPQSKEAVVKMLNGIATKVDADFARFTPRAREVRPITGAASTKAISEPRTSQEAALMALGIAL